MKHNFVLFALLGLLLLVGCGGGNSGSSSGSSSGTGTSNSPSDPAALTLTGNWRYVFDSQAANLTYVGTAPTQQSGTGVSGNMSLSGTQCGTSAVISGNVGGQVVNLQLDEAGEIMNLTGTIDPSFTSMSGTFTAGGSFGCVYGDHGTWSAVLLSSQPSLTGAWQFIAQSDAFNMTYVGTASVQQAGNVLNGDITLSGDPCATFTTVSGNLTGRTVNMQFNENGQVVNFTGTVNSSFTSISGTFGSGAPSGCTNGDYGTWSAAQVP